MNGATIPGALNIDLDIPVVRMAEPMGAAFLRVWGVSVKDISQASDLNGMTIEIYGGMQKGLPLANPEQAGLLLRGTIQQSFGNWQGTSQSVDFIIQGDYGTQASPKNIVLNWKAGQTLGAAAKLALETAFPSPFKVTDNTSPNLVLTTDEPGYSGTIVQFAQYLQQASQNIVGGTYQGVQLIIKDTSITLYDGTTSTTPIQLQFIDLIGQPTWMQAGTINFKCVMRSDIQVGAYVQLPKGQQTILAQSYSQYRNNSAFQGIFQIRQVRHLGNFRQRDASSWVTVFDAFQVPS